MYAFYIFLWVKKRFSWLTWISHYISKLHIFLFYTVRDNNNNNNNEGEFKESVVKIITQLWIVIISNATTAY